MTLFWFHYLEFRSCSIREFESENDPLFLGVSSSLLNTSINISLSSCRQCSSQSDTTGGGVEVTMGAGVEGGGRIEVTKGEGVEGGGGIEVTMGAGVEGGGRIEVTKGEGVEGGGGIEVTMGEGEEGG